MSFRLAAAVTAGVVCVALAGNFVFSPPRASAPAVVKPVCSKLSLPDEFAAADVILTGAVFAVLSNDDGTADVLITTQEIFKGDAPETGVTLAAIPTETSTSGSAAGDLHFTSGDQPYFLVLHRRADGRYNTSRCNGSRLLENGLTIAEQRALSGLQSDSII